MKVGCTLLAAIAAAMVLCAGRPAHAQFGVNVPGAGRLENRLIPFEKVMVDDFRAAPSQITDPHVIYIDSIDWANRSFTGYLAQWMDIRNGAAQMKAMTGQIRPISDGYEVTFVARKSLEQTSFTGRLIPTGTVLNGVRQCLIEGQYTYTRSRLVCGLREPCGTMGPFPCRLEGWLQ